MDRGKLTNYFIWLVNRCSESFTYTNWSDEHAREDVDKAFYSALDCIKREIDWKELTDDDCNFLRFGRWSNEEDARQEIEDNRKLLERGEMTQEKFDKEKYILELTANLRLIPLYLYTLLPKGLELICIDGSKHIVGKEYIDMDSRLGRLAYGIIPKDRKLK